MTMASAPAVTFFEISGPDVAGLRRFYAEALGLPLAAEEQDGYTMIDGRPGSVPGGVWDASAAWPEGTGTYAVPLVEVPDLDAAVERAAQAGAQVVVGPRDHGPTRTAHLLDPAGNRFGLFSWSSPPGA